MIFPTVRMAADSARPRDASLDRAGVDRLRRWIDEAEALVVGIGSGMSSAAGFDHYHWSPWAQKHLGRFRDAWGVASPMDGLYRLHSKPEERWAYLAAYSTAMLDAPLGRPYADLVEALGDKPLFVLTTNVDCQPSRAFGDERTFAFQGDVRFLQCRQPCCDELHDARRPYGRMLEGIGSALEIPGDLVPRCPACGWQMEPWVRDDTFLQGARWREGRARYEGFLRTHLMGGARTLFLELGVGEMTPSVITLPFWEMTQRHPAARFARVNLSETGAPAQLGERALSISGDLADVAGELKALR